MTTATAPGKLILCGEHAVVYGRPAIAVPLADVRAQAEVFDAPPGTGVVFEAPDLGRGWSLEDAPADPLSELVAGLLPRLVPARSPDLRIAIRADIPVASGMGSGAAIATAIVRALATHYGRSLAPAEVSALVYASERRFHGTPSGIDNTVVAFERAVWFRRVEDQRPGSGDGGPGPEESAPTPFGPPSTVHRPPSAVIEPVGIGAPLTLLVGDTGLRSPTRLPVGAVRERRQAEPARYEALFDAVGALVLRVREALAAGDTARVGALLGENHGLLHAIGVSSPELDRLVDAALGAGALGAKLSGAGWGGVMIALVAPGETETVRAALLRAGAARVLGTVVDATQPS